MTCNLLRSLSVGLLAACLFACSGEDDCCSGEPAGAPPQPVSGESLYQLDHTFTDQSGQERRLVEFRGQPALIAMIFTQCSFACPAIVTDIKRTLEAVGAGQKLHVVLVTMDVERDQPPQLAKFAEEHGLQADQYSLLHGDADAAAEVAAVLGVRFSKVDGGDYSHSNQIALLNSEGEIGHRHQGLATDIAPLVEAIGKSQ